MLPRDVGKLRQLSGCTSDAIICYFYRRRKYVRQRLGELPDLRDVNVRLVDTFGNTYSTSSLRSYEYLIDKYSLKVRILAKDNKGRGLVFDIDKLSSFCWTVKDSHQDRQRESSSKPGKRASSPPSQDTPKLSLRNEAEYFPASFQDS